MIGDSAKDDIVSGNRAGAITVLLDTEGKWKLGGGGSVEDGVGTATDNGISTATVLEGEMIPTFIVSSLAEVGLLLEQHYELIGTPSAVGADR